MKFAVFSIVSVLVFAAVIFGVVRVQRVLGRDVVREPKASSADPTTQPTAGPLAFTVKDIDGRDVNLSDYRGKVVLLVNVASKCGFTKQYAGLEKMFETYKDRGFVVVAFPANNFRSQEPGTDQEIKTFCTSTYGVSFPMMSKISVAGDDQHPLYKFLTEPATNGDFAGAIGWNFTKFLIGRDGNVYARFGSKTDPADPIVVEAVEKGLAAKAD